MLSDFPAILFVIAFLAGVLQVTWLLKRKLHTSSESSRKTVHVAMGVLATCFPFMFHHAFSVVILSVLSCVLMALLRYAPNRFGWKQTVCRPGRRTFGELLFPLSIGILFVLAQRTPILYCVPIAILTLADAASAMIGMRYGARHYHTADGSKTAEGSLVFFVVAFLCTHVALLLCSNTGRVESLLISTIVGILAMMMEGIAWRGLDNLFVPIGTYLALKQLHGDTQTLCIQLGVLSILLATLLMTKKGTTLNGSAVLGVALYSYFAWIIGGIQWVIAPLIVFMSYRKLLPERFKTADHKHSIYGVAAVACSGLVWLLCTGCTHGHNFLFPYTLALASHEAIIGATHLTVHHFNAARFRMMVSSVCKSWLLLFVPWLAISGISHQTVIDAMVAPLVMILPALLLFAVRRRGSDFANLSGNNALRWLQESAAVTLCSTVGLLPCFHFGF